MSRAELQPEDLTAVIDTREQRPLDLMPMTTVPGTLTTGDYSIVGLESVVTVERKSLDDLCLCVGKERERFDREMERILAFPARLLLIESSWNAIESGMYRSQVSPAAVQGSLLGWMAAGVPVFFARDHVTAGKAAARFLFIAARRRWREAQALVGGLKIASEPAA